MKKLIIFLSILFTYQVNYAQWHGVPMPTLQPAPNGQTFSVLTNYIINHPDTIIGMAVALLEPGKLLRGYFYSLNRGQSYNMLLTRPENTSFVPPIQLGHGLLFDHIYIPNNDFTAWDTTSTVNLFKNLQVDPWWYKRHGNYLEDSVGYYVTNTTASAEFDTLFKSTDLGLTKTIVLDSITWKNSNGATLKKIFILDKNHVWARRNVPNTALPPSALSSLQYLYRTRDGGATWQRVATNLDTINQPALHVYDIYFVTPDTGFMSLVRGSQINGTSEFHRTTDGGFTWVKLCELPVDAGIGMPFNRLFFVNSKIGFSYGVAGGIVRKTTDGGYSWVQQQSLPVTGYREMTLTRNNVIWVRNSGGGLYYTTNFGDPMVGVEEIALQNQLSVALYPNPAKGGIFTLQWDAETKDDAQVAVYDVMGKQVYNSLHNSIQHGTNQIELQLEVKPGIYYVRMQQGGKHATKSVVISR